MNTKLHRLLDGQAENTRLMHAYDFAIMYVAIHNLSVNDQIEQQFKCTELDVPVTEMLMDFSTLITTAGKNIGSSHSQAQQVENSLRSWNLKYDDFPEIERSYHVLRCGQHVIVFPHAGAAMLAQHRWEKAMQDRSNGYWNTRGY